jgi:hypothetical protein
MHPSELVTLRDDIIRGASAIAAEIGVTRRKAFYLLENKRLPAAKEQGVWISSRSALRRHYADLINGALE